MFYNGQTLLMPVRPGKRKARYQNSLTSCDMRHAQNKKLLSLVVFSGSIIWVCVHIKLFAS